MQPKADIVFQHLTICATKDALHCFICSIHTQVRSVVLNVNSKNKMNTGYKLPKAF